MLTKKTILLLLLSSAPLLAKQAQEISDSTISSQTTQNIAPKQEQLIRDVSWSGYTYFNPLSYYTLLDPIYDDKVTMLEEEPTGKTKNYICAWLGGVIPRRWNVTIDKTTTWNYDALDALYVGIQGACPNITQASINLLPISKAIFESGRTTDLRLKKIVVEGKVDLSQFIMLNYECMDARINKFRYSKVESVGTAGATIAGVAIVKFLAELLTTGLALNDKAPLVKKAIDNAYLLSIIPLVSVLTTQHVQNLYMDGYVKNFEVIMNSDKVVFDKCAAKDYLEKLSHKVKMFGFGKKYAVRLQALVEKL